MSVTPYRGYEKGYSDVGSTISSGITNAANVIGRSMEDAPKRERDKIGLESDKIGLEEDQIRLSETKRILEKREISEKDLEDLKKKVAGDIVDNATKFNWDQNDTNAILGEMNHVKTIEELQAGLRNLNGWNSGNQKTIESGGKPVPMIFDGLFTEGWKKRLDEYSKNAGITADYIALNKWIPENKPSSLEDALGKLPIGLQNKDHVTKRLKEMFQSQEKVDALDYKNRELNLKESIANKNREASNQRTKDTNAARGGSKVNQTPLLKAQEKLSKLRVQIGGLAKTSRTGNTEAANIYNRKSLDASNVAIEGQIKKAQREQLETETAIKVIDFFTRSNSPISYDKATDIARNLNDNNYENDTDEIRILGQKLGLPGYGRKTDGVPFVTNKNQNNQSALPPPAPIGKPTIDSFRR